MDLKPNPVDPRPEAMPALFKMPQWLAALDLDRADSRCLLVNGHFTEIEGREGLVLKCLASEAFSGRVSLVFYVPTAPAAGTPIKSGSYYLSGEVLECEPQDRGYTLRILLTTPEDEIVQRRASRINVYNMTLQLKAAASAPGMEVKAADFSGEGIGLFIEEGMALKPGQSLQLLGLENFISGLSSPLAILCTGRQRGNLWGFRFAPTPDQAQALSAYAQKLEKVSRYFRFLILHGLNLLEKAELERGLLSADFADRQIREQEEVLKAFIEKSHYDELIRAIQAQVEFIQVRDEFEALRKKFVRLEASRVPREETIRAFLKKLRHIRLASG